MPEIYNDIIDQGATFYRQVTFYTDAARTIPLDLTDKTPRGELIDAATGQAVTSFSCARLGDFTSGKIAWSLSKAITATLDPWKSYIYHIDLDYNDNVTTLRGMRGSIEVSS